MVWIWFSKSIKYKKRTKQVIWHSEYCLVRWFYFPPCSRTPAISLGQSTQKTFLWDLSSDEQKNSPLLLRDSLRRPTIICLFSHHWPSTFLLSYSSLYFLSFYFLLYNGQPPKRKLSRLLWQTYLFVGVSLRKKRFYHEKNHLHQNHSTPHHRWNHAGIFDI